MRPVGLYLCCYFYLLRTESDYFCFFGSRATTIPGGVEVLKPQTMSNKGKGRQ